MFLVRVHVEFDLLRVFLGFLHPLDVLLLGFERTMESNIAIDLRISQRVLLHLSFEHRVKLA